MRTKSFKWRISNGLPHYLKLSDDGIEKIDNERKQLIMDKNLWMNVWMNYNNNMFIVVVVLECLESH